MSLRKLFRAAWPRFRNTDQPDNRQHVLESLQQQYIDEAKDVRQFTEHARRMAYPHFRERLQRIAEEEQSHVAWLADQIQALGGETPHPEFTVHEDGKNIWECLRLDEEEERRDEGRFVERINALELNHPELAAGLRRIRAAEKRHRDELLDLALKSNPNGLPVLSLDQGELDKQKQEWLEQQKMEWFDKRQAAWEAGGKQTPWAEWVAEREVEWKVSELPSRELQWLRRVAEQQLKKKPSSGLEAPT
jgi:rubrerythrin